MERDLFWPVFMSTLGIVLAFGVGAVYVRGWEFGSPDTSPDTTSLSEPFQNTALASGQGSFSGYFYRESLPFGFEDRSWEAKINWRSNTIAYDGSYSAAVTVVGPYGGVEVGSPRIPVGSYHTLSFAYNPDASVSQTVVAVYDRKGVLLGQQPIDFYASSTTKTGWKFVSIPLANIGAEGKEVGSVSFSSGTPGVFHLDEIALTSATSTHALYVGPIDGGVVDPFKGALALSLPYQPEISPNDASHWYTYRGRFVFSPSNVLYISDDLSTTTTDGLSLFRDGRSWTDYRFDTTMKWGTGVSYALLVRVQSDAQYVSCSYALNGMGVQIYNVQNGKAELLSQTPELPYHTGDEVMQISAAVHGTMVECYLNKEKVLQAEVPTIAKTGTVGIESWDPVSGAYPHTVTALSVSAL